jgi:DNA-binding transcriptional LysR family regulator
MEIAEFRPSVIRFRMNWNAINFDWNQARAFLATAEEGSLSAAARALGLTQPTLGRQVAALEEALGVLLFDRVGRSLVLTPAGLDLLDHVRAMGAAAGRVSLAASGKAQEIAGKVSITASDVLSAYVLPPILAKLRDAAPGIAVEVVAANDVRDLRRREADIAIRHVSSSEPELIEKRLPDGEARLYAAPALIDRVGAPKTVEDLRSMPFVGFDDPERLVAALAGMGLPLSVDNVAATSNSGIVSWGMVRAGLGVGIMSRQVGEATPDVVPLLPDMPPIPFSTWLATHRELRTSRRIRLVYDLLAEELPGA